MANPDSVIPNVLSRSRGGRQYLFGTAKASVLAGITYVPLNEQNPKSSFVREELGGYQRCGSASRMKLFKKYLEQNPSAFVPPLLLSAKNWEFRAEAAGGDYGVLLAFGAAAIVDGQHRAGGYFARLMQDEVDSDVDFICCIGLDKEEEQALFLDVNNNQRGVDKGLSAFLRGGEFAIITESMNRDSDSPFMGRIARQALLPSQLFKFHSFAQAVEKTFAHGALKDLSVDVKIDALKRYWDAISDTFDDEWGQDLAVLDQPDGGRTKLQFKLLELTGLLAWSLVAPQVLADAYISESFGFDWHRIQGRIQDCKKIDWRKDGQYAGRTGTAGATVIRGDIERLLPSGALIENSSDEQGTSE